MARTIKLSNKSSKIKLYKKTPRIVIKQTGRPGAPGKGVPSGGTDGQYLVKDGNEDYKLKFITAPATDKYFEMNFSPTPEVTVNHNLNKFPSVTIMDSAGDEVEMEINHLNKNAFKILFGAQFSGTVYCN